MSVTKIASRYAKALFDLSQEQGKVEEVFADIQLFAATAKESADFSNLLRSPIISADVKNKCYDALFSAKVSPLTMQFLRLMTNKGREEYLAEIAREFIYQYRAFKGITTLKITTAVPFTEEGINNIVAKLKANGVLGQHVEVEQAVDPDAIGGFMLEFDNKIYDATVDYKLDQLRRAFSVNTFSKQY